MNISKILGRMALAACAVTLAGPAQAMAATPEVHPVKGEFPVTGISTFGATILSTNNGFLPTVSCTEGIGTYRATSKSTGEETITLKGCKWPLLGVNCTLIGLPSGWITFESVSHLVYLDENHTKPGVLRTPPPSGLFAKFRCGSNPAVYEVKGPGMLAEITTPECGSSSGSSTVVAETSEPATQQYLQVEETGSSYDLKLNLASMPSFTYTMGMSGSSTIATEQELALTCPEQHE